MTSILYTMLTITCFVITSMLLWQEHRSKASDFNNISFRIFLLSVNLFTFSDIFWGILYHNPAAENSLPLFLFSSFFYFFATLCAYCWFIHVLIYVDIKHVFNNKIRFSFAAIPVVLLTIFLIVNYYHPLFFTITDDGVYELHDHRFLFYGIHFFYFGITFFATLIHIMRDRNSDKLSRYFTVLFLSTVIIIFGVCQMLFPEYPFYNLGFMLSSLLIYLFNSSKDYLENTMKDHEAENLHQISQYKEKLQEAVENSKEIYSEILKMQGNGLIASDMDKNIVFINDAAAKLFGWENAQKFTGNLDTINEKTVCEYKERIEKKIGELMVHTGKISYEVSILMPNTKIRNALVETSVKTLSNGKKIQISSYTDITSNKRLERELILLSETDPLTGISNRRSGEQKTELLILHGQEGMYCVLDADKFKTINDTFGHSVGDQVLIAIAHSMRQSFRGRDVVMRLGGDEFSIYAVGITSEDVGAACLERFFAELEKCHIPELKGYEFSVSVGAVLCNSEFSTNLDTYYKLADEALYISKDHSGNHFEFANQIHEL